MKYFLPIFVSIFFVLSSCSDEPINTDESLIENELIEDDADSQNDGPVTDCDEELSSIEMHELWEMMNASTHHENNVCFTGYVYLNTSSDELNQGMIAFSPFSEEDSLVPSIYCKFTGNNNAEFTNYEIGDKIEIMGEMLKINDMDRHNFMMDRCSIPNKGGVQQ